MKQTNKYELTIIIPVYNEDENLADVEQRMSEYLPQCDIKACVLFVNDGSRDASLRLIKEICKRNTDFYFISSKVNHGLSTALKAGIDSSESPFVGYIDSDLQTDPCDFNLLIPYRYDYQLVMGIRNKRRDSLFKRLQSKIANSFRRAMTGDHATDTGCPLKIMNTEYAKRLPFFDGMHRFLPALMMLEGGRMKELPVRHYPRMAGTSKYSLGNRLFSSFADCFAFRWMKKRYIRYVIDEASHNEA
jgi:dolichol-phosphate mannosyltransferase